MLWKLTTVPPYSMLKVITFSSTGAARPDAWCARPGTACAEIAVDDSSDDAVSTITTVASERNRVRGVDMAAIMPLPFAAGQAST